ncbi:glycosyltransferase family A protein [Mariniflexile soesokkakense]|uniref:Glycosyltransferase family A protein n=1 Tax=Mariniflexile soesokkakense TaxID=1343160 RepID=A0ABV0A6H5_9FLAO
MIFSISVVIPVYNCERFIEKAILSVLKQPEVSEIIVVNDGSTDDTQIILKKLENQNPKIKIYQHENKINKGRSASRNLGIKKAKCNYIAFLDADDFYLENRFKADKVHFENNPFSDGVYNAIGAHFYRETTLGEKAGLALYTVKTKIEPEHLFETLFYGKEGQFSIDGLTIKKSVFDAVGYFDESLQVMEDTELFYKIALKCKLQTGIINRPVAIRGVHEFNVFNRKELYNNYTAKVYELLFLWSCKNGIPYNEIDTILKRLWILKYKEEDSLLKNIKYWKFLFVGNPKCLFSLLAIKYFPVIRLRKKLFPFLYRS